MEIPTKNQQQRAGHSLDNPGLHAPIAMIQCGQDGKILYCNERALELLEQLTLQSPQETDNVFQLLTPGTSLVQDNIQNYKGSEGKVLWNHIEKRAACPGVNSGDRYLRLSIYKSGLGEFIMYVEDVTAEQVNHIAMQQLLADRTIVQGRFEVTANVLHDIGNGIVGIGSYHNRIKRSLESDNAGNLLNLVDFFTQQLPALASAFGEQKASAVVQVLNGIAQTQKAAQDEMDKSLNEQQHIITHIQAILNLHRQYNVSGQDQPRKKTISIAVLIKDCLSMLAASFSKRDIHVSVEMPGTLPALQGDQTRLMQVMLNILKNATEAIEFYAVDKNILITVSDEPGFVIIAVKDSGSGFDEQTGAQLFRRGFTTKSSGSGLGLSSCKAIVESHGGMLSVTSAGQGKGATTTIKLKV